MVILISFWRGEAGADGRGANRLDRTPTKRLKPGSGARKRAESTIMFENSNM
jgi:hypothetical protein